MAENLTDIELAYIAGIVDGEGSIFLFYQSRDMFLRLVVAMCHEPTIQWLADRLQTKVSKNDRKNGRDRPTYVVRLTAQRAVDLCHRLLPFLITKKAQACTAVRFGETLKYRYTDGADYFLTDEMRRTREECFTELRELNKRGV